MCWGLRLRLKFWVSCSLHSVKSSSSFSDLRLWKDFIVVALYNQLLFPLSNLSLSAFSDSDIKISSIPILLELPQPNHHWRFSLIARAQSLIFGSLALKYIHNFSMLVYTISSTLFLSCRDSAKVSFQVHWRSHKARFPFIQQFSS
jgi:hypothetical protein